MHHCQIKSEIETRDTSACLKMCSATYRDENIGKKLERRHVAFVVRQARLWKAQIVSKLCGAINYSKNHSWACTYILIVASRSR